MDLTSKTVCFLGDSITEGVGASTYANCYVAHFTAAHPEATVHNHGISGTRIARQYTPYEKPRFDLDFPLRVADLPENADLICVFGGTNDYGHGDAPMGKWGDTTKDTFFGALYELSNKLITKYPRSRIVFFTPLHRKTEQAKSKADGMWELEDYAAAIRQTAAYFAIPVLDLRVISGIQPAIEINAETYAPDGLHPNDCGHERLFRLVDKFIADLV